LEGSLLPPNTAGIGCDDCFVDEAAATTGIWPLPFNLRFNCAPSTQGPVETRDWVGSALRCQNSYRPERRHAAPWHNL